MPKNRETGLNSERKPTAKHLATIENYYNLDSKALVIDDAHLLLIN